MCLWIFQSITLILHFYIFLFIVRIGSDFTCETICYLLFDQEQFTSDYTTVRNDSLSSSNHLLSLAPHGGVAPYESLP